MRPCNHCGDPVENRDFYCEKCIAEGHANSPTQIREDSPDQSLPDSIESGGDNGLMLIMNGFLAAFVGLAALLGYAISGYEGAMLGVTIVVIVISGVYVIGGLL